MKYRVIYVPGLGDKHSFGQVVITKLWRLFGIQVHYLPLKWSKKEGFRLKLNRLIQKIDEFSELEENVYLVGVSAGASAVINAYSVRKNVKGIVCICGKINNPQTVNEQRFIDNPAFKESLYGVQKSLRGLSALELQRIMSIHPLEDRTVPPKDTLIPGAREYTVHTKGHVPSIYYCLFFKGRMISEFFRSLT